MTIRLLAYPTTQPHQLARPGHLVIVRTRHGGVLAHAGVAKTAVDLAHLAGEEPVGVFSTLVSARNPTGLRQGVELEEFAASHGLAMINVSDLASYRRVVEPVVVRGREARLPLRQGQYIAIGYRSMDDEREHIAFLTGTATQWPPDCVRVLRECLLGHVFRSVHCDCRQRLDTAFDDVAAAGEGVVIYVRARQATSAGMMMLLSGYSDAGGPDRLCGPLSPQDQRIADQIVRDLRRSDRRTPLPTPRRVLPCEPDRQLPDDSRSPWTSSDRRRLRRVCLMLSNQLLMPAQQRLRRHDPEQQRVLVELTCAVARPKTVSDLPLV